MDIDKDTTERIFTRIYVLHGDKCYYHWGGNALLFQHTFQMKYNSSQRHQTGSLSLSYVDVGNKKSIGHFQVVIVLARSGQKSADVSVGPFNVVALLVNFSSACLTGSAPLTVVQLLWVNMIMDTLGALALATKPPTDELMERTHVGRKGNFTTNVMWRNIMGQIFI
ncbi:calcium-transporting ATPase 2, plasma membrane-type-like protein [Tanacetum coccineum]